MKLVKRQAMRALYRLACIMGGYIGKEITQAAIIAVVVFPSCYLFLMAGIALSV